MTRVAWSVTCFHSCWQLRLELKVCIPKCGLLECEDHIERFRVKKIQGECRGKHNGSNWTDYKEGKVDTGYVSCILKGSLLSELGLRIIYSRHGMILKYCSRVFLWSTTEKSTIPKVKQKRVTFHK